MNVKKRIFTFFLAVIAVFTISTQVWAVAPETASGLENDDKSVVVAPRVLCSVCNLGSQLQEVCERERNWYDVSEHYSGGKRCLVNYFTSGGHYYCGTCGATRPFDYVEEFGDQHYCIENHSSCGKGDMSVCTLDLPPYPFG